MISLMIDHERRRQLKELNWRHCGNNIIYGDHTEEERRSLLKQEDELIIDLALATRTPVALYRTGGKTRIYKSGVLRHDFNLMELQDKILNQKDIVSLHSIGEEVDEHDRNWVKHGEYMTHIVFGPPDKHLPNLRECILTAAIATHSTIRLKKIEREGDLGYAVYVKSKLDRMKLEKAISLLQALYGVI